MALDLRPLDVWLQKRKINNRALIEAVLHDCTASLRYQQSLSYISR